MKETYKSETCVSPWPGYVAKAERCIQGSAHGKGTSISGHVQTSLTTTNENKCNTPQNRQPPVAGDNHHSPDPTLPQS